MVDGMLGVDPRPRRRAAGRSSARGLFVWTLCRLLELFRRGALPAGDGDSHRGDDDARAARNGEIHRSDGACGHAELQPASGGGRGRPQARPEARADSPGHRGRGARRLGACGAVENSRGVGGGVARSCRRDRGGAVGRGRSGGPWPRRDRTVVSCRVSGGEDGAGRRTGRVVGVGAHDARPRGRAPDPLPHRRSRAAAVADAGCDRGGGVSMGAARRWRPRAHR